MAVDSGAGEPAHNTQGMLAPGSDVAGFVIEERIGIGGMAVVYRARDTVLGRLVAVKVLSPSLATDEEFRIRFLRESRAIAAVDEPHIIPVYRAGEVNGILYITTKYVADGDLSRLQNAAGGPLPPARVASLISQVASALDAAHAAGIVHRDVKPSNILVERAPGRPDHAYLSDFGLSKSTAAAVTGLTRGRFMGTPDYCAPEQVTGAPIDGRADEYALACVAFRLLAGAVPFADGDSMARLYAHVNKPVPLLTSVRPELPFAVNAVLSKGMAKSPADRYESCSAFAAALGGALGAEGPGAAAFPGTPGPGYQQVASDGGWRYPTAAPAAAPPVAAGWPGPSVPPPGGGSYPPGVGSYPPGGVPYPPGGPLPPGPGQMMPPYGQGPPPRRKRTGLIVGGSAAAAVILVAGIVAGVVLTGNGSPSSRPSASATTSAPVSPPASQPPVTGTASLVGALSAPANQPMTHAFFSADGDYVAAVTGSANIYVFGTQTMSLVKTLSVGSGDGAWPVGFSPDDSTLYAVDLNSWEIYDLSLSSGQATTFPLPQGQSFNNSFGSGTAGFFETNGSGFVSEYDMATGKDFEQVPNPGKSPIVSVLPDSDGGYLLIDDKNGTCYLVNARTKQTVGTFQYTYAGSNTTYPSLTLDGNIVYVPGGTTKPARLWDTRTKRYVTPANDLWPTNDNGVTFGVDSRFAATAPSFASEAVDIWNIDSGSHIITVTIPGNANQGILDLGPGGSTVLTTEGLNTSKDTFTKFDLWTVPG